MAGFRLSAAAAAGIESIGAFKQETWGPDQATAYLRVLRERMRWLAARPRRGKARPELHEGLYSFLQESHVIYYRIGRREIEIVRVLHRRMEPLRHVGLDPTPPD